MRLINKEMAICRTLAHSNLVKAYDSVVLAIADPESGKKRPAIGFTMELIEGSNLPELLDGNPFSSSEIDKIMCQLLEGPGHQA